MRSFLLCLSLMAGNSAGAVEPTTTPSAAAANWTPCGWGGGGFYYATAFHPARDGVLYLAGDVGGVYKSEDRGRTWAMVNNGLVNYGVFTLAVDRKNPETLYAATEGGLCKSIDGGSHWKLLPKTGPRELHITGEKGKSIRCVAVDPSDGNIVYAGTPTGKIYKSIDGGQTWSISYEKKTSPEDGRRTVRAIWEGKWCFLRWLLDAAGFSQGCQSRPMHRLWLFV